MSEHTRYVIQLGHELYLDDANRILRSVPDGAQSFALGGGHLPIRPTTGDKLNALLPRADGEAWESALRGLGIKDEFIGLLNKVVSLLSAVLSAVDAAKAIVDFLGSIELFDAEPSVEDLLSRILEEVLTLQQMLADADRHAIRIQVEDSRQRLGNARRLAITHAGQHTDLASRELGIAAHDAHDAFAALLNPSRWETLYFVEEYERVTAWLFYWRVLVRPGSDGAPSEVVTPFPDQPSPPVFDGRNILSDLLSGAVEYLTVLRLVEPQYRSTGRFRQFLLEFADQLDGVVQKIRQNLVCTEYPPAAFESVGIDEVDGTPLIGGEATLKWNVGWRVGALDLRISSSAFFAAIATDAQTIRSWGLPLRPTRLGTFDVRWRPPHVQLEYVPERGDRIITPAHWRITNAAECAAAANAQARDDYDALVIASSALEVAQLAATFRFLATHPTESETVSFEVRRRRRLRSRVRIKASTRQTITCPPKEYSGLLERHEAVVRATITTWPRERDQASPITYAFALVALDGPFEAHAAELARRDLGPDVTSVEMTASTFDSYVAHRRKGWNERAMDGDLTWKAFHAPWLADPGKGWGGQIRNEQASTVRLRTTFTESENVVTISIRNDVDDPNVRWLYVVVTETLMSSETTTTLSTYVDVSMDARVAVLPKAFFDDEQRCLERQWQIVRDIGRQGYRTPPPRVPPTPGWQRRMLERVRKERPDMLEKAIRRTRPRTPRSRPQRPH